jgi:multidrug resistance efflux pump
MATFSDALTRLKPKLPTLGLALLAALVLLFTFYRWTQNPWTRDGQVRADIVEVAPRVSGYIVEVAVKDNQFVRKGEVLFRIDPSSFRLSVDTAQVQLDQARENVAALEAEVRAAQAQVLESEAGIVAAGAMVRQTQAALTNAQSQSHRAQRLADEQAGPVEAAESRAAQALEAQAALDSDRASLAQAEAALVSSKANLDQALANLGEPGDANVRVRQAMVQLAEAELKLSWTAMNAPFDGYITNLDVNEGEFGFPGIPIAAFVDSSSFRVDGYFQESKLRHIKPGDRAIVTLMSHPGVRINGVVDSIGYAINPPNIADTEGTSNLIPQVEPTFDWVRLPQRVPVRINLESVPDDVQLISGMTASVAIRPSRD